MKYKPLTREEVISVIEGRADKSLRVPQMIHFWTNPVVFGEKADYVAEILNDYPCDADFIWFNMPRLSRSDDEFSDYMWIKTEKKFGDNNALDSHIILENYDDIDSIIADFPVVNRDTILLSKGADDGRYKLACWWYCLFENHWSIRGMENALTDYYLEAENVHKLFRKLTDFFCDAIEAAVKQTNIDGIFFSDDIGHQTAPFFSLNIFNEFFKPYYKKICDKAHSLGVHVWLHSCGNIEEFIPGLIEVGFDVLHPIQKYTMDEAVIAEKYGKSICIWAGMDVQQTIPWGTAEDVRNEVRFLYDTYGKYNSRFMITAGNGITSDCKAECLYAFIDEAYSYNNSGK